MAFFPSVRGSVNTNGSTASSAPVVTLPTYQAGDVLFVMFRVAVAGAVGWPAGWTEVVDASPDAADDQISMAWKRADGADGPAISLSCSNGKFAAVAFAIQDAFDPAVQPPELSTVATGTSATQPDATTCTPSGGTKDYLWLTLYSMEGEQTGITSYPASYTLGQIFANSGTAAATTTNVTMGGAARQSSSGAEDAGAWTVAGTRDNWSAYTVAFSPGVPVTTPGRSDAVARPSRSLPSRSIVHGTAAVLLAALAVSAPVGANTSSPKRQPRPRAVISISVAPPELGTVTPDVRLPGAHVAAKPPPGRQPPKPRTVGQQPPIVAPDARPPGHGSAAKPARARARLVSVSSEPPVLQGGVTPDVRLPGVSAAVKPPRRPKARRTVAVGYSLETPAPFVTLSSHAKPPAPAERRRSKTSPVRPPVVPPAVLPPGERVAVAPPTRPAVRSRTVPVPPPPPAPLPVGVDVRKAPPTRPAVKPRTVGQQPPIVSQDTRTAGKNTATKPPRRKATKPRTVAVPPPPPQALPPGERAAVRPPTTPPVPSRTVTPAQPVTVAQAIPPGGRTAVKPTRVTPTRSRTATPAQPVTTAQALPPGQRAATKPTKAQGVKPKVTTPAQPIVSVLPPGARTATKPPTRRRRPSVAHPAPPPVIASVLPPGQSVAVRPPIPAPGRHATRALMPPPPTPLPIGRSVSVTPPRRPPTPSRVVFVVSPFREGGIVIDGSNDADLVIDGANDGAALVIDGSDIG
jgi:hypothetical protein